MSGKEKLDQLGSWAWARGKQKNSNVAGFQSWFQSGNRLFSQTLWFLKSARSEGKLPVPLWDSGEVGGVEARWLEVRLASHLYRLLTWIPVTPAIRKIKWIP